MPRYFDNKQDNVSTLTAEEYNRYAAGHNATVTSSGQTLNNDANQYSVAMAQYASDGNFYSDSGSTANTYVAVTHDARNGIHELVAGVEIRFIPLAANTAANPTIAVNGLTATQIKGPDGTDINPGDFSAGTVHTLFYDGTNFRLLTLASGNGSSVGDEKYTMLSTAPSGWIFEEGQELSRDTFANLWNWAVANSLTVSETVWQAGQTGLFSTGNGSTTFRVPDMRGEFIRIHDNGAGNDPDAASRTGGDAVGSVQDFALQNITGSFGTEAPVGEFGSFRSVSGGSRPGLDHLANVSHRTEFDASLVAQTSTETRPRNVYRKLIIKT